MLKGVWFAFKPQIIVIECLIAVQWLHNVAFQDRENLFTFFFVCVNKEM